MYIPIKCKDTARRGWLGNGTGGIHHTHLVSFLLLRRSRNEHPQRLVSSSILSPIIPSLCPSHHGHHHMATVEEKKKKKKVLTAKATSRLVITYLAPTSVSGVGMRDLRGGPDTREFARLKQSHGTGQSVWPARTFHQLAGVVVLFPDLPLC